MPKQLEPDLKSLSDLKMAEELARCVVIFERQETEGEAFRWPEDRMIELARAKAACKATSAWLRSWSAAGIGGMSENPLADEVSV